MSHNSHDSSPSALLCEAAPLKDAAAEAKERKKADGNRILSYPTHSAVSFVLRQRQGGRMLEAAHDTIEQWGTSERTS